MAPSVAQAEAFRREAVRRVLTRTKTEYDAYTAGRAPAPPVMDFLILSGGGDWGAFGAGVEAGATGANYILLRLPLEIGALFTEWLHEHAADWAARVLNLMRDTRGGRLYQTQFGRRMCGSGALADLLADRFRMACRRLGLNERRWDLDAGQFRLPPRPGDQLALL
jgi:hypothetical protein